MLRLALMSSILIPSLSYGNNLNNLAEELLELRSQVESLHDQLEQQKQSHQAKLQSLNVMKADLAATNQRESLQLQQLNQKISDMREDLGTKFSGETDLTSFTETALADLRSYVSQSLPFKGDERLATLNDIDAKLRDKSLSPYKAANMLWAFVEDELRLQKDVGLYKQVLTIDGDEQLCEVAKIGMLGMLVKSPDGKFGKYIRNNEQWSFVTVEGQAQQKQIEDFFVSLKKQIRVGSFTLPKFI
ncbi:DUF3450 family protein [Pseudobacteriovorax antillogorgiicola]|uniref:DUF3450 domain-containing protein n=1 Tax=Pseudobacteriovorax antillogorgiicola TaxID=1513793 RepID=A0A1Y6CAM9_9BACT|nr:DUF3450 family protein [Pseudobacteriovorax antillogorgiicola]TCS48713.1 uncharacterized protein DUF3450 [Pseudobacteriovorax antillogorgiicola]SMF54603.1 Protein of unknown function [Pseudobacteriovorax antillogorgiicola]